MVVCNLRVRGFWLLVACCSLLVSACGGSPNQPSDQYPNVSGTYRGTLAFSVDGELVQNTNAELVVEQDGSEVTLSFTIWMSGAAFLESATGTISRTGVFTAKSSKGGVASLPDASNNQCGSIRATTNTLSFSGDSATYALDLQTDRCGMWSWSGILQR